VRYWWQRLELLLARLVVWQWLLVQESIILLRLLAPSLPGLQLILLLLLWLLHGRGLL